MVVNHWNIGSFTIAFSLHCNRWNFICHTQLASSAVYRVNAVVCSSSVLVIVNRFALKFAMKISPWIQFNWNFKCFDFFKCRYVLPESPRWLLAKGRVDELKKIIETAARWNKRTLPPNYERLLIVPEEEDSSGSFLDLFKLEYLRTTLLLMVAWYALVLQYMAITLHIGEMGGNIYLTTVWLKNILNESCASSKWLRMLWT